MPCSVIALAAGAVDRKRMASCMATHGYEEVSRELYPEKLLYPRKIHPEANCKEDAFLDRPAHWHGPCVRTMTYARVWGAVTKWTRDPRVATIPGRHAT